MSTQHSIRNTFATIALVAVPMIASAQSATAVLKGKVSSGMITFTETGDHVAITAHILGLTPGSHGFHIHDVGDCSKEDFSSAGPHFNPSKATHGGPESAAHHAGDLGNLVADRSGEVKANLTSAVFHLTGPNSIIGKSVVVHEKEDDLKSDPSGNSGSRIACGVIEAKQLTAK